MFETDSEEEEEEELKKEDEEPPRKSAFQVTLGFRKIMFFSGSDGFVS